MVDGSKDSFIDKFPLVEVSSGFFIGLAIGYFFKKSIKLFLIIFAFAIVVLFVFQSYDMIQIKNDALLTGTDKIIVEIKNIGNFLKERLEFLKISGGVGAIAGFMVGLKMG